MESYPYLWLGIDKYNFRKNISRICGKLNIEHILEHLILKDKEILLKQILKVALSYLGMIPIFMSDKISLLF